MRQFRIAFALGYPHPDRLLAELTGSQLGELYAYVALEPWVLQRADLPAGIVAAAVSNAMGSRKQDGGQIVPADFMPFYEREPEDPDQLFNRIATTMKGINRV